MNPNKENILTSNVLIIDNIGMLSNIYKYGNLAYIGGGFGAGIHNILEAAMLKKPILVGPFMTHFKQICTDFIKKNARINW